MGSGYISLAIALGGGLVKAFCGKKTSGLVGKLGDAVFLSFFRMLLCILIGGGCVLLSEGASAFTANPLCFGLAAMSGVFTASFLISWLFAVQTGAFTMIDVFITLGTIIPMRVSTRLLGEAIRPMQWLGFLLLVISVLVMCSYNNSIKTKMTVRSFLLLVLAGASNGMADLSQKLFTAYCIGESNAVFNFYTYLICGVLLGVLLLFQKGKAESANRVKQGAWYILFMAIGLFVNSFFKVQAAQILPAARLYPVNQGAALILTAVMAAVFFGEKITPKCVLGLCCTFVALCMMNLF